MAKKSLIIILILFGITGFFGHAQAGEKILPRGPSPQIQIVNPQIEKPVPKEPSKVVESVVEVKPITNKAIYVSLKNQDLKYFEGTQMVGEFKISSGLPKTPTPPGTYEILKKLPKVTYKGVGYYFPNTKWNLLFKQQKVGNLYIHGAYWHNKFGQPMSHGCINVAYADVEKLYAWADLGTKVQIE